MYDLQHFRVLYYYYYFFLRMRETNTNFPLSHYSPLTDRTSHRLGGPAPLALIDYTSIHSLSSSAHRSIYCSFERPNVSLCDSFTALSSARRFLNPVLPGMPSWSDDEGGCTYCHTSMVEYIRRVSVDLSAWGSGRGERSFARIAQE